MFKKTNMNVAVAIITALGAYCPFVKISDETALAEIAAKNKRRVRSMLGRGNYGKGLKAHFDKVRYEAKVASA